jgi:hypothetical protein
LVAGRDEIIKLLFRIYVCTSVLDGRSGFSKDNRCIVVELSGLVAAGVVLKLDAAPAISWPIPFPLDIRPIGWYEALISTYGQRKKKSHHYELSHSDEILPYTSESVNNRRRRAGRSAEIIHRPLDPSERHYQRIVHVSIHQEPGESQRQKDTTLSILPFGVDLSEDLFQAAGTVTPKFCFRLIRSFGEVVIDSKASLAHPLPRSELNVLVYERFGGGRPQPAAHRISPRRRNAHLKVIVLGDGGKFLETKVDKRSVHKTKSLSWLAQFVVQIITTVSRSRTEGIENLADFRA